MGQAGCAAGFLGLVEAVRQLTDRNLARAVPGARFGLAVGFGMITYDRGLCCGSGHAVPGGRMIPPLAGRRARAAGRALARRAAV